MIHKLVKIQRLLKGNPSTTIKEWSKDITKNERELLIANGYITKVGDKKGAKWYWNKGVPDYDMEVSVIELFSEPPKVEQYKEATTLLEVFVNRKIKFNIGNGMSVLFKEDSVDVRKSNGKTITVTKPRDLNDLLDFLL